MIIEIHKVVILVKGIGKNHQTRISQTLVITEVEIARAERQNSTETKDPQKVLGEVEDAASTYDSACAVVVPLHAGSGMRIKLAEALAAGRPVVTTSKGMEGLDLQDGVHVLVADTAEAMSDALIRVLTDAGLALHLGQAGRQWALDNMGHRARAKTLTQHLSEWVRA